MKLPLRELLPGYLKTQRWLDLADAIDAVFGNEFGMQEKMLKYLRYQYIENENVTQRIAEERPVNFMLWDLPDRKTAAEQVELQGFRLYDSGYLNDLRFVSLSRNISDFWYSKGKADLVDFISFTMNSKVELFNLWTQDYIDFVAEDDLPTGYIPIYEGGTWYPTTHVRLRVDSSTFTQGTQDVLLLARLFLDLANYTLVLHALEEYMKMWVAPVGATLNADDTVISPIVAVAMTRNDKFILTTAP